MKTKELTLSYYNRFPTVLKDALRSEKVRFPNSLQCEYEELCVFRGVRYTATKTAIDKTDFLSYMELKKINPMIPADDSRITRYSCSLFMNIDELHQLTKFPNKNKAIAKGLIRSKFGPIDINEKTSHIDLFLYDNIDPSSEFEVVEKWEKNG